MNILVLIKPIGGVFMNWKTVTSVEDLKSLGSFKDVKECIRLETKQKITARGWDDLFKKISEFKPADTYFISDATEYIFYLVELDGEARTKKLNITSNLFKNQKAAKSWRDKISKTIHPDICHHVKASEAMTKVNELYQQMTGRE